MFENFVESDSVNLWTVSTGTGIPVMLCSGGPGCPDYLEPIAAMLNDAAQVIRFEERGCGRSLSPPPFNIETTLKDLENIRRHYQIDRWIIGGHSWGADLALFYALEHPSHAAGLICIAGGRTHNDREWHSEYKRNQSERGEQLPHFDYPINMEVNSQVNGSWKRYIQNPLLLRKLSKLITPALFVYGQKDIRPSWAVEQVANLMSNARFEIIENAEHLIWLSHTDKLKSLLQDFVDDVKRKETLI